jgi:hypothetical protein
MILPMYFLDMHLLVFGSFSMLFDLDGEVDSYLLNFLESCHEQYRLVSFFHQFFSAWIL